MSGPRRLLTLAGAGSEAPRLNERRIGTRLAGDILCASRQVLDVLRSRNEDQDTHVVRRAADVLPLGHAAPDKVPSHFCEVGRNASADNSISFARSALIMFSMVSSDARYRPLSIRAIVTRSTKARSAKAFWESVALLRASFKGCAMPSCNMGRDSVQMFSVAPDVTTVTSRWYNVAA